MSSMLTPIVLQASACVHRVLRKLVSYRTLRYDDCNIDDPIPNKKYILMKTN